MTYIHQKVEGQMWTWIWITLWCVSLCIQFQCAEYRLYCLLMKLQAVSSLHGCQAMICRSWRWRIFWLSWPRVHRILFVELLCRGSKTNSFWMNPSMFRILVASDLGLPKWWDDGSFCCTVVCFTCKPHSGHIGREAMYLQICHAKACLAVRREQVVKTACCPQ